MTKPPQGYEHPLDLMAEAMERVDDRFEEADLSATPLFAGMSVGFAAGAVVAEKFARRMFDRGDLTGYMAGLASRGAALSFGVSAGLSMNAVRESIKADREIAEIDRFYAQSQPPQI